MKLCWTPVYDYGCGWRECPECGPMIELEIDEAHRAAVDVTFPSIAARDAWLAEAYGTGEERTDEVEELEDERREAKARASRAKAVVRVRRVLTPSQQAEATAILDVRAKKLRGFSHVRDEWLAEVWIELLNPTRLIHQRESKLTLERRVRRAIDRAQDAIRRSWEDENPFVLVGLIP